MDRPWRVVYIYETLGWGGAETTLRTILRYLQTDSNWSKVLEAKVICLREPGPIGQELMSSGIEVIPLRWQGKLPAWRVGIRLRRLLRALHPDVVRTAMYQSSLCGVPAARLAGCPVVLMGEHGFNTYWMGRREKILSRLMARLSTKVIALSHPQAQHLVEALQYPEHKVVVVPNCIDPQRLGGQPGFAPCPDKALRLTSIGSLRWVKNHALLLHAFQKVLAVAPMCELRIVGEGPLRAELTALAQTLGIAHRVQFLGVTADMRSVLAQTDLYVTASYLEALSIAMGEAMYAGCPCIAPGAGGLVELTAAGKAAVLVSPNDPQALADAILRLLDDVDTRRSLAQRAVERICAHYLPEHHLAKLKALLETLVDCNVAALGGKKA